MKDTSRNLRTSGSEGSESTTKTTKTSAEVGGTVRLKSLCKDGGENPGTGLSIPAAGSFFEADAERGAALILCGLAEAAPEGAKGE